MLKLNKEPVRIHDLLLSMVKEYRTEVIKEDHARQVRLLYRPNVDGPARQTYRVSGAQNKLICK